MKKYSLIVLSTLILGAFFVLNKALADDTTLTQKDIADSAKPSIVKIVQHVKGDATIPGIKVDFNNLTVTTDSNVKPQNIQINEYLTGSGFIVSPDGYIMTNSHVVSYQTIKNLIVSDYIFEAVDQGYSTLTEDEAKKLNSNRSQDEIDQFGEKITDYILNASQFNLDKTITVLNPSSTDQNLVDLVSKGFPATVISVNDNFFRDSRDAALIKIDQTDLPAISLGTSKDVSAGKKVFIYGYPSTAEVSSKDLLEPTFSEGSVNATKDSLNKDFKILQTDAKISKGSSGGPLLDEQGKVVGLVTFITSDLTKQDGDSFAFAIPIDVAKDIVAQSKISGRLPSQYEPGAYNQHFLAALPYFKSNQCKKAITEFNLARQMNSNFPYGSTLDPYVSQCNDIISSGKSVDSIWAVLWSKLKNYPNLPAALAIGFVVVLAVLGSLWIWLFRRMKQEEVELDNVEKYLHLNLEDGSPDSPDEPSQREIDRGLPDSLRPKL